MNILITGASGFIGKRLCPVLLEKGHTIIALERAPNAILSRDIKNYIRIPYTLGEELPEQIISLEPDVLIHLAWDGIPDFSEISCINNLKSQVSFFNSIKQLTHLKKIISAGSCKEYGSHSGACKELSSSHPIDFFSWAKLTLSDYIGLISEQNNISCIWLRIFYVYGPGQRSDALIPSIIQSLRLNKEPAIKTPFAANDYIFIDDVVTGFINAIEYGDGIDIFNLGSGRLTTVKEIVDMVKSEVEKNTSHDEKNTFIYDEKSTYQGIYADLSHSNSKLNWLPQTSLRDGIRLTLSELIK